MRKIEKLEKSSIYGYNDQDCAIKLNELIDWQNEMVDWVDAMELTNGLKKFSTRLADRGVIPGFEGTQEALDKVTVKPDVLLNDLAKKISAREGFREALEISHIGRQLRSDDLNEIAELAEEYYGDTK